MLFRLFVCITCILIASNHLFLLSFNTLILSLCEQAHLPTVLKSRLFFLLCSTYGTNLLWENHCSSCRYYSCCMFALTLENDPA